MAHDSEEQPITDEAEFVQAWLDAIESASDEEKDWRDEAKQAVEAYRGKDPASKTFNLYHANIETIVPALYNSVPAPDVRRRFLDPNPAAKIVADIIERALSYSIDAYDFDASMNSCVRDMAITGRGVQRVRYKATFGEDESVAHEETVCEYVPWRAFRRGPGRLWSDVTWIAFEHFLDRATIEARVTPGVLKEIPFRFSASAKDGDDDEDQHKDAPRFGKRARVWEIWDKDKREVHFIAADYTDARLWTVPDPLELLEFFPIPRPMQAVTTTDSLVPVASYTLYKSLLEELNDVSRRIKKLVAQLKPRGIYADAGSGDLKLWTEADDGELVPLSGAEWIVQSGGSLEKAITWFPLEPIILALRELVQHREMIKQNIYEVTKIADVMRGVSKPNETLGAQNLKAEWGSLSIQKMQGEVARFARDLFRLKAEVMAGKMDFERLLMITGIQLPTEEEKALALQQAQEAAQAAQAAPEAGMPPEGGMPPQQAPEAPQEAPEPPDLGPSREEVEQLLRSDAVRGYHIDIESDSTIRADLGRQQEQMSQFFQGAQHFAASFGPMVASGHMPPEVAVEGFAAMARRFKLGKQFEDALDQWADTARNKGSQQAPDPAAEQAQAQQQAEQMKMQAEMEMKGQELQADQQKTQAEMEAKTAETQARMQLDREKMQADFQARAAELQIKQRELEIKERELGLKAALQNKQLVDEATQEAMLNQDGDPNAVREPTPLEVSMQQITALSESFAAGLSQLAQGQAQLAQGQQQQTAALTAMVRASSAPKRVVRGEDGRAIGVETVPVN